MKMLKNKKILIIYLFLLLVLMIAFDYRKGLISNNQVTLLTNTDNNVVVHKALNLPNINKLKAKYKNNDIKGFLYIPDIKIKEPVVQASDNEYYLWRNLYGNTSDKGVLFFDYRFDISKSKKNIIYGHNSYKFDLPFKKLENYYEENFYKKHKYIYLEDINNISKYEIFSVFIETHDWTFTKMKFNNNEEWSNHLKYLKDKSMYDTGVSIEDENILILQTCSHHKDYKNYKNKYLIIVSKKVETI